MPKPELKKAEIKQAVIDVEKTKASYLRVPGMHGKYIDITFDNDGYSDQPVPEAIREKIINQYPGAIIEEVDRPVI